MDSRDAVTHLRQVEESLAGAVLALRQLQDELVKDGFKQKPEVDQLLTVEQVASLLGVDKAYVYTQARAGKIPSVKLGKYRRFSPSQIKKWLDRKAVA